MLKINPEYESFELNRRLNLAAEKEPVKLRVVEKAEPSESFELLQFKRPTTNFSDVVGLEEVKKQINKKIIPPFQKPSLFQRFKKKVGGGIMLYGPPGRGKTLLARATAGECKASFFNIEISDVLDMYIGSPNKNFTLFLKKHGKKNPVSFSLMSWKRLLVNASILATAHRQIP
ncbi:MAG: ATP-binding protein [Rheinheimera sp.]|nr:ATP-binding protein [Rheinheimera sp.]